MQNFIKNVVWVCLALIPFIALHVADGSTLDILSFGASNGLFFPFIAGKNIIFRVLVEVAFAGWVILALYDPKYRINIKKSPILIAYAAFIVVLFFADIFGVDPSKSMWSNFERMEGFVGHIHLFAYFFVLSVMIRTLEEWRRMWKVFIAANMIVLVYAYGQLFGAKGLLFSKVFPSLSSWFSSHFAIHMSENRLDATIGNSAYFAIFCLMYVFIAALMWKQSTSKTGRWFYPTLIVLNLIGLFYSGTRGTMIGIVGGGLVTLSILAWKGHGKTRRLLVGTIIALIVVLGSIFAFKNTSFVKSSPTLSRIASISPNDLTGSSRISIWTISYQAWLERPVLGYGQDNFSYIFARKFMPEKMCNLEPWYDRSHDVFFDWLVAAGLLGLLTYLSLYAVTMWYMWKHDNEMPFSEKAILTGAMVGYFIHNIFVFDNLTSYILFIALLAYITVRTKPTFTTGHHKAVFDKDQMNLLVIPVVGIALLVTLYFINYRPLQVNRLVIKAMSFNQYAQTMPIPDAVKVMQDSFAQAIKMDTLGSLEAREQFFQMAVRMGQVQIPDSMTPADKQATVQAINNLILAARQEVTDSYPRYKDDVRMLTIYGMFYNGIGDAVSAEQILTHARELAPNKQLISFDLTRAYLMQKKYPEAYDLAKSTYDLSTSCNGALKWFAIAGAYSGKYNEVLAYSQSKGQNVGLDPDVLSGLVATGQIQTAIQILEQAKKENPALAPQIDAYIKQLVAPAK